MQQGDHEVRAVVTVRQQNVAGTHPGQDLTQQGGLAFEASDDYGIAAASLTITLAQGTGENIAFKEQTLALVKQNKDRLDVATVPELDARLTYAYLKYASDLLGGSVNPKSIYEDWVVELLAGLSRREQEELLKLLAKVKQHTVGVLS